MYLAAIRREADALREAAARGLEAPVPGCPGWTVGDLVFHVGSVHRFHAAHVVRGATTRPERLDIADPDDADLLDWFDSGVAALLGVLRETDPAAPAWNFSPDAPKTAAFWPRRMALETAVHRWDAQSAHGVPEPLGPALAVDGIDEVLTVHLPADLPDEPVDQRGVVRVSCPEASWTVRIDRDRITPTSETPDAALEGAASDVLLALWGRVPLSVLGAESPLAAALRTS